MCGERQLRGLVVALALVAGCGDHRVDLSIALATDTCTTPVPAGGSLLYQITGGGAADLGAQTSFCGGCLAVTDALPDSDAILTFLRANAPTCAGVKPSTTLQVALTAFSVAGCADSTTRVFCSKSAPVTLPDGHVDAVVTVTMTCDAACAGGPCKPTTCAALGKNCGPISDGCGGTLQCGVCTPPQQCGGHGGGGTPNVCSK